ncbi:MAG: amidase [Verrucomicrobia bacterium]|nr:amidase [Verrucomicrobiota bacterium]
MTFADWRNLSPAEAARTLTQRVASRLRPGQQRAALARLLPEDALAARFATARRDAPLGGVPYFAKDLFDAAGLPTLAGSTFLPEVRPAGASDGAFVAAVNAAGAVLAGKTHLHEFAYGITGENPHYGDVEHPRFPGRTSGGSSSGSAAVVAAGVVPFSLGSDTGGSVRVPAAFCGLFGFRMTPRDAWIADAFPLSPSMDTAGWFTTTAGDMRESLAALVGLRTSQRAPRGGYLEMPGLDTDVATACRAAAERLTSPVDAAVRDDLLSAFARNLDTYNTLVAQEAWEVHKSWAARYEKRYDPNVWPRLNRVHTLTPAQIDAAQLHLVTLRGLWTSYFLTFDYLVMAASPCPALTKAQSTLEFRGRILTVTSPASLGGLPVLTIPVELPSGLTTGLQVIVNHPQSPVVNWALEKWR